MRKPWDFSSFSFLLSADTRGVGSRDVVDVVVDIVDVVCEAVSTVVAAICTRK